MQLNELFVTLKNHFSVIRIKENMSPHLFDIILPETSREGINKSIRVLNIEKSQGPNSKPLKLIKVSVDQYHIYQNIICDDQK